MKEKEKEKENNINFSALQEEKWRNEKWDNGNNRKQEDIERNSKQQKTNKIKQSEGK